MLKNMDGEVMKNLLMLCGCAIVIAVVAFGEDMKEAVNKHRFENRLSNDFSVLDVNLKSQEYIEFSGYENKPCKTKLETNSDEVNFSFYSDFVPMFSSEPVNNPTVAYFYKGKLYVADYIKKYTTKDQLLKYVTTCDEELSKSEVKEKSKIQNNQASWE